MESARLRARTTARSARYCKAVILVKNFVHVVMPATAAIHFLTRILHSTATGADKGVHFGQVEKEESSESHI
ncbi:unnamed protein product, partial [Mesorhabditis belari]|uniref:Uncharacterized protein n=1 Tax=Mesorhabditis belari TaxID=2138241 RepID=A0AAF3FL07_9BILA